MGAINTANANALTNFFMFILASSNCGFESQVLRA
jgi:hypothetical protein